MNRLNNKCLTYENIKYKLYKKNAILGVSFFILLMFCLNYKYSFLKQDININFIFIIIMVILFIVLFMIVSGVILKKNQDLFQLRALKNDIEKKEKNLRTALNKMNDAFWEYNLATGEIIFTEKWTDLTGHKTCANYQINEIFDDIIHPDDKKAAFDGYNNYIKGVAPFLEGSFRLKNSKGEYIWLYLKGAYQDEDNSSKVMLGVISDITKRKSIEDEIKYMAFYDGLTGLPNKMLFQDYMKKSIINCIDNNKFGALIFLDIDDFKNVNDTLGHDYGDQLLKIISELLKVTLGDSEVISRTGGDEFLILVDNLKDKNYVIDLCENIISIFKYPFEIGDKSIYTSVSIGITFFPGDSTDINELFRNADTAMYKSKEDGKNKFCIFDTNMGSKLNRKIKIGNLLREAIESNELYIMYQPQYDIKTEKIVSLEALLRWNSKELGSISPIEFIPIAENNGIISSIGKWVFNEVCKQNKEWQEKGYKYKSLAVNISSIEMQDERFVEYIISNIRKNNIEPSSMEIEITESLLMANITVNERKIQEIKNFGVRIAIDDFGTGYSSLNYLTHLSIDTLKIDKSFIDNITTISNHRILTENIIKLSHDLNFDVVAEGVETKEQLEVLKNISCDIIQGYYFSKPLFKEEVEEEFISNTNGDDNIE